MLLTGKVTVGLVFTLVMRRQTSAVNPDTGSWPKWEEMSTSPTLLMGLRYTLPFYCYLLAHPVDLTLLHCAYMSY